MTGPFAMRLFRIVFVLAGCYNLAFGAWAVFCSLQFFALFEMAPPRYPQIWACVGMVVGVYGLLYWHAAWKPEHGRPIIAIGLVGKVLGPIGMVFHFGDDWPRRLALLNLYNDVIWWLPFVLFLLRGSRTAARLVALAPWCCAVFHALGLAAMGLVLRQGMLTEPDAVRRAAYIWANPTPWAAGWAIWMLAALSLVAFYAWWGARIAAPIAATVAVLAAALGSIFDLSGESVCVLLLVESARASATDPALWDHALFETHERIVTLLTAGAANLLYTLGGLVLMLWTADLPRPVRLAMWATWASGVVMTLAAVFNHVGGLVAATAVLFPSLIAWTVWMAHRWRKA